MLKLSLFGNGDPYIHIKGTITIPDTGTVAASNNKNRNLIFKNCVLFTDGMSEINDTLVDNAKDIDAVTAMYKLTEYDNIYLKHQAVYGSIIEINQLWAIMVVLLIFLLIIIIIIITIIIIAFCSNLKNNRGNMK